MEKFPLTLRLPPYVFSRLNQEKQLLIDEGTPIYEFGMGNPDKPTPPHIIKALEEAAVNPKNHGYAKAQGNDNLRQAIVDWYQRQYDVLLDKDEETIVTMGSKEGLSHLAIATVAANETVVVPNPCYPIHQYAFVIAGAHVETFSLTSGSDSDSDTFSSADLFNTIKTKVESLWPKPKMLLLNFPSNPTAVCVDLDFFGDIIALAKKHNIWVVHDFAYADIGFDGYKAPSILQVPGAKDIAVESYTLSKSYNMAGWRVGFMSGNAKLIAALRHLKAYFDYGLYTPIQEAAIAALRGPKECVAAIRDTYQHRRDVLCDGLNAIGWPVVKPKATMFVWAKIPEDYLYLGAAQFSKLLLEHAHVAVSAGSSFGTEGDAYVRFSLILDDEQTIAALARIDEFLQNKALLDVDKLAV